MYPRSVHTLQADALFASALQRGDDPSISQVRRAVAAARHAYGDAGCAGRVAQEFGDHPETAAARMRWARTTVAVLEGQAVPRPRRAAGSATARRRVRDGSPPVPATAGPASGRTALAEPRLTLPGVMVG